MGRLRRCDACGKEYVAQRASSRFCSPTCRVAEHQRGKKRAVTPVEQPSGSNAELVEAKLAAAGRLETPEGGIALSLGRRFDQALASTESGSSIAALSRELRASLVAALDGATAVADSVEDLRARRAARARAS